MWPNSIKEIQTPRRLRVVDRLRVVETRIHCCGSLFITLCLFYINFNFIYIRQTHRVTRDIDVYWHPAYLVWGRYFPCISFDDIQWTVLHTQKKYFLLRINIVCWLTYIHTYIHTYILTYVLTYLLTPWSRVLLEKLTGFQLVKKFPIFYWTRRFIIAFTSVHNLSLYWASSIQSIPPTPYFLKIHLNIILPSTPGSPKWPLFLPKSYTRLSSPPYVLHTPPIIYVFLVFLRICFIRLFFFCRPCCNRG